MVKKRKNSKIVKLEQPALMLDFGCGETPQPGYEGVDLYSKAAVHKVNLFQMPLPWKDESVGGIWCSHFIEHIPQHTRWAFFNECWRIMKPDGVMRIFVPNWKSERAYGDMTHEWPPVSAMAFYYLNREWRKQNKLEHGPYSELTCNFDFQAGPTELNPKFVERTPEVQQFACAHYVDSYPDMWVTLTRKP